MHIPASELQGAICPVTAVVATVGVSVATLLYRRQTQKPSMERFLAVTSIVFVLQMLNVPIGYGVSAHLLGGVLAALLLGTPAAVLAVTVVLVVQALLLGDGGVPQLGANILNMALIGAGLGGWLAHALARRVGLGRGVLIASVTAILLAVTALATEFALHGTPLPLARLYAYHLPMALLEGVGTLTLYAALQRSSSHVRLAYAVLLAVLLALVPLASTSPDGLMKVLGA